MLPIVRNLYKRIILVGKDYPLGLSYVRNRAKEEFLKNSNISEGDELMKAIGVGRYYVKEMIGVIQLKKYRSMKQRYYE